MKSKSIIREKSYLFARQVVDLYKQVSVEKREYVLSKQLLRSGTSIGANITEALSAISTKDFSAKMSIAYKEAHETKYWLSLLCDSEYISKNKFSPLYQKCEEICKILFSILKTTRLNN